MPHVISDCEMAMPKTKKHKRARSKKGARSTTREVVLEQTTRRVVYPKRVVVVKSEPVTLAKVLGEAAVVEPTTEPSVSSNISPTKESP